MKTRTGLSALAAGALVGGALLAAPATAQDGSSSVRLVHGVPDTPVDVCVDGTKVADDFQPATRSDALTFDVGDHTAVVASDDAGDDCSGATDTYVDGTVNVPDADLDLDLVAHWNEDGSAVVLTTFQNDTAPTSTGDSAVTFRHAAATGALDAYVDETIVADGFTNGEQASADFAAGSHTFSVTPADTPDSPFVANETLTTDPGVRYLRYVVSGAEGANGDLYAFTIQVGETEVQGDRIGGRHRFETAVLISQEAFPNGSDVVYIARHDDWPDSLAGSALVDNGPILIVPSCTDDLNDFPDVVDELERLNPDEVVALGGDAAVCDAVLDQAVAAAAGS